MLAGRLEMLRLRDCVRQLRGWLVLPQLGLALSVGCVTVGIGDVPECPPWTPSAIADLVRIQETGEYQSIELAIGEQEIHCEALEAWNGY